MRRAAAAVAPLGGGVGCPAIEPPGSATVRVALERAEGASGWRLTGEREEKEKTRSLFSLSLRVALTLE